MLIQNGLKKKNGIEIIGVKVNKALYKYRKVLNKFITIY